MNEKNLTLPTTGEVKKLTEGEMPYTLTRLEWLEVKLNIIYSYTTSVIKEGYNVSFDAMPSKNMMIILGGV